MGIFALFAILFYNLSGGGLGVFDRPPVLSLGIDYTLLVSDCEGATHFNSGAAPRRAVPLRAARLCSLVRWRLRPSLLPDRLRCRDAAARFRWELCRRGCCRVC